MKKELTIVYAKSGKGLVHVILNPVDISMCGRTIHNPVLTKPTMLNKCYTCDRYLKKYIKDGYTIIEDNTGDSLLKAHRFRVENS